MALPPSPTKVHLASNALKLVLSFRLSLVLYNLSRALEFVHGFLECVLSGEEDLVVCANIAYEKSLKKFHGWIVRGIFKVNTLVSITRHLTRPPPH